MAGGTEKHASWDEVFLAHGRPHHLALGEVLYRQGDLDLTLMRVESGLVKLVGTDRDGNETLLGFRRTGDLLGLDLLLGAERQTATAICVSDVAVRALDGEAAAKALAAEPHLYRHIAESIWQVHDSITARLVNKGQPLERQVMWSMAQLASAVNPSLPLSTKDLASAVGAPVTDVVLALDRLSSLGIVKVSDGQIDILNYERLLQDPGDDRLLGNHPSETQWLIVVDGVYQHVLAGGALTFGRAKDCNICLDTDDIAVSRQAGSLYLQDDTLWLANNSSHAPLTVIDDLGFRQVLPPGKRTVVEGGCRILIDSSRTRPHVLLVQGPQRTVATVETEPPGCQVVITDDDRLAMVVLFAEYLEDPPRSDPQPKSYRAAAARLNVPRSTLVKRIEYLRARLDRAGVPNMTGFNALNGLAEYALLRRLITKDDLVGLRRG